MLLGEHRPASDTGGVVAVSNGFGTEGGNFGWLEHGLPQCSEVECDDPLSFGTKGLEHLMKGGSGVRLRAALLIEVVMLASMQKEEGTEFQPRYARSLVGGDGPLVVEKHAEDAVLSLIHAGVDGSIVLVAFQLCGCLTVSIQEVPGNAYSGRPFARSDSASRVVFVPGGISSAQHVGHERMDIADQFDVALLSATEEAGKVAHLLVALFVSHGGKAIGHVISCLVFGSGNAVLKVGSGGMAFDLGECNGMGSLDDDDVPELLPKVTVSVA